MATDVLRLDLRLRRRATLSYAAGLALYALVIVAVYPQFEHSTSLDNLTKNAPTISALLGAIGSLTSPTGWLEANIYANFFPLVMLLLAIGYGAGAVAGQNADGTLGMVTNLPFSRNRILVEKSIALGAQGAVVAGVVAIVVMAGRGFHLDVSAANVVTSSLAVWLMALDLGLFTLAVGAATNRRGTALGVVSAVAAGSYLISSLAPVIGWVGPIRYLSLFYWSVGNEQLSNGTSALDFAVLLGVGTACLALALETFDRLDVH